MQRLADSLGIRADVATVQQSPNCAQQGVDVIIEFVEVFPLPDLRSRAKQHFRPQN